METIKLGSFAPAIAQKAKADEIYMKIKQTNPQNGPVEIDLDGIIAMTTQCARLIFGKLYMDLTADTYYNNIKLKNCSDELDTIINMGIEHAIRGN